MIRLSVLEIEGGYPERDGGEGEGEGLVLEYSSSWIDGKLFVEKLEFLSLLGFNQIASKDYVWQVAF